jgi:hypothetical protein
LFLLSPMPEVRAGGDPPPLQERFWLCERCSKIMTVVWDGEKAGLKVLPQRPVSIKDSPKASLRSDTARAG